MANVMEGRDRTMIKNHCKNKSSIFKKIMNIIEEEVCTLFKETLKIANMEYEGHQPIELNHHDIPINKGYSKEYIKLKNDFEF